MKKLIVTPETFVQIMYGLIESGVTFTAEENMKGEIEVTFTGRY